jgi:hypothetical protein
MDVATVLARAKSATGKGIRYKLGAGGMKPGNASPAAAGKCDCTGFVAWCLGFSRKLTDRFYVVQNGGWFETTAVWKDIESNVGIIEPSDRRPGAIIVYPDVGRRQGHIGIIVDAKRVIHCSKGNDTKFGDAVQITSTDVFDNVKNARVGWLHGLQR